MKPPCINNLYPRVNKEQVSELTQKATTLVTLLPCGLTSARDALQGESPAYRLSITLRAKLIYRVHHIKNGAALAPHDHVNNTIKFKVRTVFPNKQHKTIDFKNHITVVDPIEFRQCSSEDVPLRNVEDNKTIKSK